MECVESDMQMSLAVRIDSERKLLGCHERSKLLSRQQVLVEVLELARAVDPDISGSKRVLESRQGAQLVISAVPAGNGRNELRPAVAYEIEKGSAGEPEENSAVNLSEQSAAVEERVC